MIGTHNTDSVIAPVAGALTTAGGIMIGAVESGGILESIIISAVGAFTGMALRWTFTQIAKLFKRNKSKSNGTS